MTERRVQATYRVGGEDVRELARHGKPLQMQEHLDVVQHGEHVRGLPLDDDPRRERQELVCRQWLALRKSPQPQRLVSDRDFPELSVTHHG